MSLSVEILKASYGDAFILYCEDNERKGTVVVDGGPKSTSLQIVRKLRSIGCIDLMILSHFDHDHIAGLYRYICTLFLIILFLLRKYGAIVRIN